MAMQWSLYNSKYPGVSKGGLCTYRFSVIDGIQVTARYFFPSVCTQSYAGGPASCWTGLSICLSRWQPVSPGLVAQHAGYHGQVLVSAEGKHLQKSRSGYRGSTVYGAGVVSWKSSAELGWKFNPASNYSLVLMFLLLFSWNWAEWLSWLSHRLEEDLAFFKL